MLAANKNVPIVQCSGSGIYSGRSGALEIFVSEVAATKILVSKVPVDLQPAIDNLLKENESVDEIKLESHSVFHSAENTKETQYISIMNQDNLTEFTVKFLNFHENPSQTGTVCNNGICCNYNIEVSGRGEYGTSKLCRLCYNY